MTLKTMLFHMLRLITHQLQIFWSIVATIFVFMMYNFFGGQIPSQYFFHYKTMFKYITITVPRRMSFYKDVDIFFVFIPTALKMIRAVTAHSNRSTRSRAIFSFRARWFDTKFFLTHGTDFSHKDIMPYPTGIIVPMST